MQTGTNRDVERLIKNAPDLGGRQRLRTKADCADATGHIAMAVDLDAGNVLKLLPQALRQRHLVIVDLCQAFGLDPLNSGRQTGDAKALVDALKSAIG